MRLTTIFLITILTLSSFSKLYAQKIEVKIEKLVELDGTMAQIKKLIEQTIDYQKQSNPMISEKFWTSLSEQVKATSLPNFIEKIAPVYKKTFSEAEIDGIIEFYSSEVGKVLVSKQPSLLLDLNMPIQQWSQEVNTDIINKIENRGNGIPTSSEIESFEQEFKNRYGLQIVNLKELGIDKEHNPGTLLIDFGEVINQEDVTKTVVVKNNTDSTVFFKDPLFLSDEIKFDWGTDPINPGEERQLNFVLQGSLAEGDRYTFTRFDVNQGGGFSIGFQYSAPQKELKYSVSSDSLKFQKFSGKLSNEYEFVVTNTGGKDFRIYKIDLDNSNAFVSFTRDMVSQNESARVKILFDRRFLKEEDLELNISVSLTKESSNTIHFADKKFNLKIN